MVDLIAVFSAACFLVLGFVFFIYVLNLVEYAHSVAQVSRHSLDIMGDATLDDDHKEKAMQDNAIKLFKLFAILTLGGALSLFVPTAIIWFIGDIGWLSFDEVVQFTLGWKFILGTTVFGLLIYQLMRKNKSEELSLNQYSSIDRLLHQIAFATTPVQLLLSNLEDRIFNKQLQFVEHDPVFITGLPRSGTTLLLELFQQQHEFSTHSYRQMPFVLMPLLWDRFASHFRTEDVPRERAHGDGMMVGLDSPEAFEEIIWMQFWREHYTGDSISQWGNDSTKEFDAFFSQHRKKISCLGARSSSSHERPGRYISKNNLNIARIELLLKNIPGCKIILPFRDPYQHAASLLHQHVNFLDIHSHDTFAKKYMAGIGHFDFGKNLKPIDFAHWLEKTPHKNPAQLSFWLAYWEAVYEDLLTKAAGQVIFSDFDGLCAEPEPAMARLADFIGVNDKTAFIEQASRIRPQRTHDINIDDIDTDLRARIDDLLKRLKTVSL